MITKAQLRAENELLKQQCLKLVKERDAAEAAVFRAESILRELKRRFELHQKHFPEACVDLYQAGVKTRQVVQPLFNRLSLVKGSTK